jgi:hypothetical protein
MIDPLASGVAPEFRHTATGSDEESATVVRSDENARFQSNG